MHQPRSDRSARAMKLGAFFLVLCTLSGMATVSLIAYGIYHGLRHFALAGLATLALSFFLFLIYRLFAARAQCPLCRGPILAGSGAQRNRRARHFFGSYRLHVAFSILFTNTFVCPYCGEGTRCTVKPRPQEQSGFKPRSSSRS